MIDSEKFVQKTENMKIWLRELYDNEIDQVHEAEINERIWALGCNNPDICKQHEENAKELKSYAELLEKLKQNI